MSYAAHEEYGLSVDTSPLTVAALEAAMRTLRVRDDLRRAGSYRTTAIPKAIPAERIEGIPPSEKQERRRTNGARHEA